jgi:DNA polymerase bacteriophage-type
MNQLYLVLDYETKCLKKIKQLGGYEYARHPSTRIRCAAWRLGTRESLPHAKTEWHIWWSDDAPHPERLLKLLKNPAIQVVAHNAFFERCVTEFRLGIKIPTRRWTCTAALARSYAFPGSLEGACDALELPVRKDKRGKLLLQRHCFPRRPTKNNPAIWNDDPEGIKELKDYCVTDVDAEVGLFLELPPLSPRERKVWEMDQEMNYRGIQIDRNAVVKLQKLIMKELARLRAEVSEVTKGKVSDATKVAQIRKWLLDHGVDLPNLQKKTIEDALATGKVTGRPKRILELRQAISKTSIKKYPVLEERTRTDGRLRDFLVYHGASPGRWAGAGVQVQNFPRGSIKNTDGAIDDLLTFDRKWVRALYGCPLEAASSALRGMITATPGRRLYAADWNAIEARIDFWLARHDKGLEMFGEGRDIYREMAALIYGVKLKDVTDAQREIGKRAILGCGYNMGWRKFMTTCAQFGVILSPELAQKAVKAYRHHHRKVVEFWGNMERAAITATQNPGKKLFINRVSWLLSGKYLFCELPSGRRLTYYGPKIKFEKTPWGEKRAKLYHWDIHPKTRKWVFTSTYGGKLVENICQGTARDVMVDGMFRVMKAGFDLMITVHDEAVAEHDKPGKLEEFERLLGRVPKWAEGLPLKVKGFESFRYRKG